MKNPLLSLRSAWREAMVLVVVVDSSGCGGGGHYNVHRAISACHLHSHYNYTIRKPVSEVHTYKSKK